MLVKDHSESDIRVDPTNPEHLIASSKWFVSAEGYNHVLGFYESFDGGKTWSVAWTAVPSVTPPPGSASGEETFIGDYFGNTTGPARPATLDYSTGVATYDGGTNPAHCQQQIVATVPVP